MFSWNCPQCGREVPPAYSECPDCARKTAADPQQLGAAASVAPPPSPPPYQPPPAFQPPPPPPQQQAAYRPPPPEYQPPPPYHPAPPPPYQPQPPYPQQQYAPPNYPQMGYAQPARSRSLPTWLLAVLFAFAFLGLGSGIYWLVGSKGSSSAAPAATVENPAAKPGAKTNPVQKYIEVTGVRFVPNSKTKKMDVKFIVINHSPAEIDGLAGNVTIWGRTQKSEEEAAGTFSFTTSIAAYEGRELTAPLTTKLKPIELPDWQNISTDVQVTSPAAFGGSGAPQ